MSCDVVAQYHSPVERTPERSEFILGWGDPGARWIRPQEANPGPSKKSRRVRHFVDFLAPMGKKRGAHKPDVKPVDATTPSPDRCASPAPEDPFQMAHAASLPPRVTTWLHVCVSRVGRIGWRGAGLGRVDTALLMRMTRESPRITHRYTPPVVRIFRSSTSPWS